VLSRLAARPTEGTGRLSTDEEGRSDFGARNTVNRLLLNWTPEAVRTDSQRQVCIEASPVQKAALLSIEWFAAAVRAVESAKPKSNLDAAILALSRLAARPTKGAGRLSTDEEGRSDFGATSTVDRLLYNWTPEAARSDSQRRKCIEASPAQKAALLSIEWFAAAAKNRAKMSTKRPVGENGGPDRPPSKLSRAR